jgi:hypothetical protein
MGIRTRNLNLNLNQNQNQNQNQSQSQSQNQMIWFNKTKKISRVHDPRLGPIDVESDKYYPFDNFLIILN